MVIEIINYRKLEPGTPDLEMTAKLFAEVFAGHPWYESTKCVPCDIKFGEDTSLEDNCPNCHSSRLCEANPRDEITQSIVKDLNEPNGSLYLLKDGLDVRGFCWGYSLSSERALRHFNEDEKLRMRAMYGEQLGKDPLFTISEIGVDSVLRGNGYGKELALRLLSEGKYLEQPVTVWTRYDAVLAPICLKSGFQQIYGPKVGFDGGRIAAEKDFITGIYASMPERVFFIN